MGDRTENGRGRCAGGGGDRRRAIVAGVSWTLASRVAAAVAGLAAAVYLPRALGPETYGLLPVATGVLSLFMLFADLGVSASVSKHLADAHHGGGGDGRRIPGLLRRVLALKVALVLGLGGLLAALAPEVARLLGEPALLVPHLALSGAHLVFDGLAQFGFRGLQGLHRAGQNALASAVSGVLSPLLAVAVVAGGLGAAGAVVGRAVGAAAAAAVALYLLFRVARGYADAGERAAPDGGADDATLGGVVRYGLALFVLHACWFVYFWADALLVQHFLGRTEVAFYSVPLALVEKLMLPAASIATVAAPYFAGLRAAAAAEGAFRRRTLGRSVAAILALYVPTAAALCLFAPEIIRFVFGPAYAPAAPLLRLYAPAAVLLALATFLGSILDYMGLARSRAAIFGAAALADLGLNAVLIPRFGAAGAIVSILATLGPLVVVYLWLVAREVGLWTRPRG